MKNNDIHQLLTLDETVDLLRVKRDWIYQKIAHGNLPFPYTKVGHFLRFPADGLCKYIESQTRSGSGIELNENIHKVPKSRK